ncbi:unnamed protein product [Rhizophagus irregularis]|uniref:Uncharacterized protein n=1 Tax=Rhizophagus irregularis TaxID=588596 RepID=A0A2N1M5B0_9GLOM|nr:hypothetical protein RhiirC2_799228 [Rhizophagus irregularis]CAB4382869.1 unnamed protein product [Rhizophagus irregularis]CAB5360473.1 unnamed protein product [Rhizophagus irregularis]
MSRRQQEPPENWRNHPDNKKLSEGTRKYIQKRGDLTEESSNSSKVVYKSPQLPSETSNKKQKSANKESKKNFHLSTDRDGDGAHWTSTNEDKSAGFYSRTIEKGRDDNGRGWALDIQDRQYYGSSDSSHKQRRLLEQVEREIIPSTSSGRQKQRTTKEDEEIRKQNKSAKISHYKKWSG